MSLVRAETSRFTARRFIRAMTALILIILGVVAVSIAASTAPITEADRAYAQQRMTAMETQQRLWAEEEYQRCLSAKLVADPNTRFPPDFDCEEIRSKGHYRGPDLDQFLPSQFTFRSEIFDSLMIATAILCLFGFVVGASFVGAEWTSGGMTNLLLWRPSRLQVYTAKLGTAVTGVLAISAAYLGLWIGTLWLIAVTRGDSGGVDAGSWASLTLTSVRALALVAATTAIGVALASLGRHTAAALGVGVGYALIAELGALLLLDLTDSYFPERYRLSTYLTAWMLQKVRLYDYAGPCVSSTVDDGQGSCSNQYVIDLAAAGTVLGLVVLLVVGASYWLMHRRDVA